MFNYILDKGDIRLFKEIALLTSLEPAVYRATIQTFGTEGFLIRLGHIPYEPLEGVPLSLIRDNVIAELTEVFAYCGDVEYLRIKDHGYSLPLSLKALYSLEFRQS
jgi:hypothetical protein